MNNRIDLKAAGGAVASLLLASSLVAYFGSPAGAADTAARKVLFVSNRDAADRVNIYTMAPNGSVQTRLTQGEGYEFDPALSPDGKRIAFAYVAKKEERKTEIYVMDVDGTNRTCLTQHGIMAFSPSWSPDGKRIAYSTMPVEEPNPSKMALHAMDADGKNDAELGIGLAPVWSPDGKSLLFTQFAEGEQITLSVMDVNGTNRRSIGGNKTGLGVWSPDGKRIAYVGEGDGNDADVFVMDADGKNPVRLTKTAEMEICPQWSEDGKRIYYTRISRGENDQDPAKGAEICSIDADGKNMEQLTTNDALDAIGSGFLLFGMKLEKPQ